MLRKLIAPARYVQGANALQALGEEIKALKLGTRVFTLADRRVLEIVQSKIEQALQAAGIEGSFAEFRGECSKQEIMRLKELAEKEGADVILGAGGGKALDTAKAVAYYAHKPVVIVPTIASTDAPCSALSVIYTEQGIFEEYLVLPRNPDLVLVDTAIIARAPVRFLVAGMGDALATWFEARACAESRAKNLPGGDSTLAALNLAQLCYETLLEDGYQACLAVERQVVTPAVERVVEANILLSGLGFESSGLAAAHAVHNALTTLEETHAYYHGEKVAFGTLVQLVLEGRPLGEIEEVLEFAVSVGLPVTLADIGLGEVSEEKLRKVAEAAVRPGETIHNEPFPVTAEDVLAAIIGADALGKDFKGF
ncbi:glycerol dehydrogenase [Ammonifex thiophilus]|uniref:Glycerol dehydrogenase n=1 Tax=Ammonifex thiophilus TaxID=444093 RepID=A0A3D8P5C3_9THEO|nr:glycerol dehydrogenase [Ammonifex thiophilus]RDV83647.1 glycerol dehydrogenase [Ammonifex thiophilus]